MLLGQRALQGEAKQPGGEDGDGDSGGEIFGLHRPPGELTAPATRVAFASSKSKSSSPNRRIPFSDQYQYGTTGPQSLRSPSGSVFRSAVVSCICAILLAARNC